MVGSLAVYSLQSDEIWIELAQSVGLSITSSTPAVDGLASHLKQCGAACAVVEETYTDRDFSDLYSRFYSKLFRRRRKTCRRVHFFSSDLTDRLEQGSSTDNLALLEKEGRSTYLGFVVVRPVPHAPISCAYLSTRNGENGQHILVRSNYSAHLQGAHLVVSAAPYTQQDTRVGACAQATIWAVARHYHARHRGPWVSMAGITEAALEQAETEMVGVTPYGSEYLNGPAMVRAFRSIGRFPLMRAAILEKDKSGNQIFKWAGGDARAVVSRYLDSGIPIALLFAPLKDGEVGHAVTAVGHELSKVADGDPDDTQPSRASFCTAILVNDDQRGVYRRVPTSAKHKTQNDDYPYTIENNLYAVFIPLPDKVYISAEQSERLAWDRLDLTCRAVDEIAITHGADMGDSLDKAKKFKDTRDKNLVYARTYLTFGWRHKQRLLKNTCSDLLKAWVASLDLPKYVWVTEFGTYEGWSAEAAKDRRIAAHTVIDATSYEYSDPFVLVHFPGVAWRWQHDHEDETKPLVESAVIIKDDKDYLPKIRGVDDLASFGNA